ncbi:MAG: hypothetical protein M0005_06740 [Actinomycetota bacterium]|jgi:hypothetical protein|nr:hypothetical protein [Actinomycetota bacterium]
MPIAVARSSSRKTLVRIERVEGMMAAPPTPINARNAVSRPGVEDHAEAAEPAANTTRPAMNTHLRPSLSPRVPTTSKRPAKTTE